MCGLIAAYNATELPPGPDRMGWLMGTLLRKRIRMQGFIVFGLENAPEAFIGLLQGKNFGKLVIQLAHE